MIRSLTLLVLAASLSLATSCAGLKKKGDCCSAAAGKKTDACCSADSKKKTDSCCSTDAKTKTAHKH